MNPALYDLSWAAWRWLEYAALVGFVGVVVVRRLAGMQPALPWARVSMERWLGAALIGGLGGLLTQMLHGGDLDVAGLVRVVAEGLALFLCLYVHRWVVPPALLAVVAVAFAGHAARLTVALWAVPTDAVHVLSAGAWAGSIMVLATLRPPGGWGGDEGHAMLERFGRIAFLAFAMTALTGVIRATEELRDINDLWGTPYGVVLSAKTAGVLVMVAMSALVSRRGWPHARLEGAAVLIVLAATALLAAFPMPPGQA